MNILLDRLPQSISVEDTEYSILTYYRDWILFEMLILDDSVGEDKIFQMLDWYVDEQPPFEKAIRPLLDFYRANKKVLKTSPNGNSKAKSAPRAYDFDVDAGLILAAFRQSYGINLLTENLHWWEFSALLDALPNDTEFVRVMGYRVADTSKMGKEEKARINKLKQMYAIADKKVSQTLAQRDAEMLKYVQSRFYESQN